MFPNAAPTESNQRTLPATSPVYNWGVLVYRKAEPILSSHAYYSNQAQTSPPVYESFYIQLQQPSSNQSSVLYFRYQPPQQRSTTNFYSLPFTISQLNDVKLSPDSISYSATSASSKFYNTEQPSARKF